jgi:hypothetical protein
MVISESVMDGRGSGVTVAAAGPEGPGAVVSCGLFCEMVPLVGTDTLLLFTAGKDPLSPLGSAGRDTPLLRVPTKASPEKGCALAPIAEGEKDCVATPGDVEFFMRDLVIITASAAPKTMISANANKIFLWFMVLLVYHEETFFLTLLCNGSASIF